ncbi:hypothetical protein Tco_1426064, partial [Tanacetum coccineum]
MSQKRRTHAQENFTPPDVVLTNDDLLTKIQLTKVDPHVGLFVNHIRSLFECDFVSLDSRLRSKKSTMDNSFTLGSTEEYENVKILQSCNGLLLCSECNYNRYMIYKIQQSNLEDAMEMRSKILGEEIRNCSGNGGRGRSIFGRGGGSLAICSMESKDGLGGGGLVVVGGRSSRV